MPWVQEPPGPVIVRERAPLRLSVNIETPSGHHGRWSDDDPSGENTPGGLSFSSVIPGGYENLSCTLQRDPSRRWSDLEELARVTVQGVGGKVAWHGRMEGMADTSGDQEQISISCVGYQSHLEDDQSARMVFVDRDITQWQDPSITRQIAGVGNTVPVTFQGGSEGPNFSNGEPSLILGFDGTWATNEQWVEMWYDAHGIPLGKLMGVWVTNNNVAWGPASPAVIDKTKWYLAWGLADDDTLTPPPIALSAPWNIPSFWVTVKEDGTPLGGGWAQANAGTFELVATTRTRKWGHLAFVNEQQHGGVDGATSAVYIMAIGVYGDHGLPLQGSLGMDTVTLPDGSSVQIPDAPGVLAADAIAYAVGRWAPLLALTTGPDGSVQPSSFAVPQLVFLDPTTVASMIKEAAKYELLDWAVWEEAAVGWGRHGPMFYSNDRNARGRKWRARSGPAQLQEAGPQMSKLVNGVMVQFTDTAGVNRYVGPPGSGANIESPDLVDSDPSNPVNEAGITRWGVLQMGTSSYNAAVLVGQRYLEEQSLINRAGQAVLTGHVQDENGVLWPYWMVHGGDQISFVDASDTSYRRIVHSECDDATKTNTLQLDAPPDSMTAILERLSVVLQPFGQS